MSHTKKLSTILSRFLGVSLLLVISSSAYAHTLKDTTKNLSDASKHTIPSDFADLIRPKELNQVSSKTLLKTLDQLAKNAQYTQAPKKFAYFTSKLIYELNLRKLTPHEESTLARLTHKIKHAIKGFMMRGHYVIEAAPIEINNKKRYIYPHAIESTYERWKKEKTEKKFDEYLKHNFSQKELERLRKNSVKYLSSTERKQYVVKFTKDRGVYQNNTLLSTGTYIFVLDIESTHIYAARKIKGRFHHSSFLAGAPVKCAGTLIIQEGKLVGFTLHSGHYRPDKKGIEYLHEYLKKKTPLKSRAQYIPVYDHQA
jgi:hypothetical protein